MRIVFFSDVHGNQYAFRAFQKAMEAVQPDKVVFLGDVFGYYYGQEEILTELCASSYICLLGNHDQMFLELCMGKGDLEQLCVRYGSGYRKNLGVISSKNIDFLRSLPSSWELRINGIQIGAFHGTPDDSLEGRLYPDTKVGDPSLYKRYDYLFLGHTHHKMMRSIGGHTIVINPGSIGQQRDGKGCSYMVFDTVSCKVMTCLINYPVQLLVEEIMEKDPDKPFLIEVLKRQAKWS